MKLEHNYTIIDKVRIHYVESGLANDPLNNAKPTMIFLHGFPEYWGSWAQQLDFFAKEYRVIAPDLPGYNLSDKPADLDFYAVPNLINFIAKFIKVISPTKPVILVAHDWGGAIAWPLTAFKPQLVSQLIILNAAHPSTFTREMISNPLQRQKSAYIHQLIGPQGESFLSRDNFKYLKDDVMVSCNNKVFDHQKMTDYQQAWQQAGAITGMLQYYRAMPQLAANEEPIQTDNQTKLDPQLNESKLNNRQLNQTSPVKATSSIKIPNIRINVPTLILWGEADLAFVNDNLTGIEQYVADVTVKRFANTSHWLQHERPDEVNQAINCFIKS
ncbi:alpha/beta fold hydrolase [Shewanella sp. UCD-KL21]|uniref:alpha/beta fold hydrolase n=1 Tax=Shewanella sp. UCD-KL21 TaxID=1917164 RepID=UPI000970464A|nr:alpha/beta hydrolase [Shewanella sp. UCD-KL21]